MYLCMYVCMYVCMDAWMYVCNHVYHLCINWFIQLPGELNLQLLAAYTFSWLSSGPKSVASCCGSRPSVASPATNSKRPLFGSMVSMSALP